MLNISIRVDLITHSIKHYQQISIRNLFDDDKFGVRFKFSEYTVNNESKLKKLFTNIMNKNHLLNLS